ncbi:MAG: tandem-95 repeat protein [Bacteroidota bacterium]
MSDVNDTDLGDETENTNVNEQQELDDLTVLSNVGNQDMGQARLNNVRQTDVSEGALGSLATIHQGSGTGVATQQGFVVETGQIAADQPMVTEDAGSVAPLVAETLPDAPDDVTIAATSAAPQAAAPVSAPVAPEAAAPAPAPEAPTTEAVNAAPAPAAAPTGEVNVVEAAPAATVPAAPEQPLHIDQLPVLNGIVIEGGNGQADPNAGGPYAMSGKEGDQLSFRIDAYDPDGGSVSFDFSAGKNGTIHQSSDGNYYYEASDPNWYGTDSVTVYVRDDEGNVVSQNISFTLTNVEDEAVATVTGGTGAESTTDAPTVVTGTITASDVDNLHGEAVSYAVVGGGEHGTLTVDANGTYTFTANDQNWNGSDSFTIQVKDSQGGTTDVTIPITVTPTEDEAVATVTGGTDAESTTDAHTVVTGTITASDVDNLNGEALQYEVLGGGDHHGSLTVDANGNFTFTANDQNWNGSDSFTVRISDAHGGTTDVTVPITVTATEDEAVATVTGGTGAESTTDAHTVVTGTISATDADNLHGEAVSYAVVGGGEHGTLTVDANGAFTFTANDQNWNGSDSFTIRVTDAHGGTTDVTIPITVTATEDEAVATVTGGTGAESTTDAHTVVTGTISATDVDNLNGEGVSYEVLDGGDHHGSLTVDANGNFTFTANDQNWNGSDSFTVRISDAHGGTTDVTVPVTVTATEDEAVVTLSGGTGAESTTDAHTVVTGTISATDVDNLNGEAVSYAVVGGGDHHGSLTVDANGNFTFTANDQNWNGSDSFTVRISDAHGGTTDVTVPVTVTATEDEAVASVTGGTGAESTTDAHTEVTGTITASDVDNLNGEAVSYAVVGGGDHHGSLTVDANGNFTFTANDQNWNGSDSFTVRISDAHGGTTDVTVPVTVTATEDEAVATVTGGTGAESATDAHTVVTGTITASDVDNLNGEALQYEVVGGGDHHGSLTVDANGNFTFTANDANWNGSDSFTIRVTDSQGGTTDVAIPITVTPTEDEAVATVTGGTGAESTTDAHTVVTGTISATDVDNLNGEAVSYAVVGGGDHHGSLTVDANGNFTFTANDQNWNGSDSFTVRISDAHGGTTDVTVPVTVTATEDEAVVTLSGGSGAESTTDAHTVVTGTISATDVDNLNGEAVSYAVLGGGDHHGSLTVDANGAFTFTANDANWNGSDSFTIRVTDAHGGTTDVTVPISVNPTDDAAQITSPAQVDITVGQNGVGTGDVNATDPDGDPLTYGVIDPVTGNLVQTLETTYGTVTVDPANGNYTFTPNDNAKTLDDGDHATDTFQVAVTDGHTISSPQTVDVTIDGANDAPVVKTVTTDLSTGEDGSASGTITATDVDAHDTVTYTLVGPNGEHVGSLDTQYGHVTIDPATGEYTFTPKDGLQALDDGDKVTDGFKVAAYDGTAYSDAKDVSVTISGSNDAPEVKTVSTDLTTDEDGTATGTITATDVDAHDTVSYTLVGPNGEHVTSLDTPYGHVEIDAHSGAYTFTPKGDLQGLDDGESVRDGFQVAAFDGTAYSDPKDVHVTINGSNDAPVVSVSDLSAGEDQTVSATATFTDVDGEKSSFFLLDADGNRVTTLDTAYGSVTIDSTTGTYTFTPDNAADALKAGQVAHDGFQVVAFDGTAQSDPKSVDVTLTGSNDAPVVSVSDLSAGEDQTVSATATFTDVDNSSTSYYLLDADGNRVTTLDTAYGSVTIDSTTGTYTFTPDNAADALKAGQVAHDGFQVVAFDGAAESAPKSVDVTINGTDDATQITGTVDLGSMKEDSGSVTFTKAQLLSNATDVDNTLSVANVKADGGSLVDNHDGTYTFTPGADYSGTINVSYDVVTDKGVVSHDSATLDVTGVADAPTLTASATVTADNSAVTLDVNTQVGAGTVHYATSGDTTVGNDANTLVVRVAQLTGGNKQQAASFDVSVVDAEGHTTVIGHGQANGSNWQDVTITLDSGFSGFEAGQTLQISGEKGTNVSIDKLVVNGVEIQAESGVTNKGANDHTGSGSDGGYTSLHNGSVSFGLHGDTTTQTPVSETHPLTISVDGQGSALGGVTLSGLPAASAVSYLDATGHTVTLTVGSDGTLPLDSTAALRIADAGATLTTQPGVAVGAVTTTFDIVGTGAADTLVGGTNSDHILGGAGDDVIRGDASADHMDVAINISATDHDTSETVTYTVAGVPTGLKLANDLGDLTPNADGTYSLSADDLNDLHIVVPAGSATPVFDLKISATSEDGGDTATTSTTLHVDATLGNTDAGGNDMLDGGAGNDSIYGGAGNDTLVGGAGADLLDGGAGNDTFTLTGEDGTWASGTFATSESAYLGGKNLNADSILGGDGVDTLNATSGNDAILAQQGGTTRLSGIEVINAGDGDDVVDMTNAYANYGDMTIDGGAGNDVLFGQNGNDTLIGGTGNDTLNGGAGADTVLGGEGNDLVVAKGGEMAGDVLDGGAGTDTLKINLTAAQYTEAVREDLLAFKDFIANHPGATYTFNSLGGATATNFESLVVRVDNTTIKLNSPPTVSEVTGTTGAESTTGAATTVSGHIAAADADHDTLSYTVLADGQSHNGSLSVDANGNFTFTAKDSNWNGSDSFTVQVSDGHGGTVNQTVNVTVTPTNDAPVVSVVTGGTGSESTTSAATQVTGTISASDVDGDTLSYSVVNDGASHNGTLSVDANGNFTFTAKDSNWNGSDSFTVQVSDGHGGTVNQTVNVTVNPTNDAPVVSVVGGTGSESTTSAATQVTGKINASDADGDTLSYSVVNDGASHNGSLSVDSNGNFTFVAKDSNWNGSDSFTVQVSDGHGGTVNQTVNVTVTPTNDAPVVSVVTGGTGAESTTNAATQVTGKINASDVDGDTLSYTVVPDGQSHNGSLSVDGNGNFVFTAKDSNWNGSDSFTVQVSDGHGGTVTQTVNIKVDAANDAPDAVDDSGIDASAQAPSLSVDITESVTHTANVHDFSVGNLSSGATSSTTGTGNADHVAVDNLNNSINLQGGDDTLVVGNQNGGATINMGDGNDLVQVTNASAAILLGEGDNKLVLSSQNSSAAVTAGSGNDSAQISGNASASINLGDGNNQLSVGGNLNGGANVTTGSGADYINVTGYDNAAISTGAGNDVIKIGQGVQGGLLDAGSGNDVVTVGGYVSSTINGGDGVDTVVLNGYTQQMWASNTNQIQSYITNFENVVVSDGHGGYVAVKGDTSALATADTSSTYTYTVKVDAGLNDTDGSETLSSATLDHIPAGASVMVGGVALSANADGTYTVPLNASGDATVTVTSNHALDLSGVTTSVTATEANGGATATTTVTGEASAAGQTTATDTIATAEDHSVTLKAATLLANDTDVEGDTLTITGVGNASHGTVSLDANGNVVFTPDANYHGTATFQYTVSDGHGGTDTATVTLQVTSENDAPVVSMVTGGTGAESTTSAATQVAGKIVASDVDGDTLSYSVVPDGASHNGSLAVDGNGNFTFTAKDANWNGSDSFTVQVSDGHGGTVNQTVNITVTPTGDASVTVDLGATTVGTNTDQDHDDLAGHANNTSLFQLNDTLYGTSGSDTLSGQLTGHDTLYGAAGNDKLTGADGDDLIYGGSGNDVIKGNSWDGAVDDDTLYGGSGNDTISGGYGHDTLYGGTGNDVISDSSPDFATTAVGGAGNDTITTGDSDDVIYGDDVSSGNVYVDLTITATDASSSDHYVLTGLPAGVGLVGGNGALIAAGADGSYTLSASQLSGLKLQIPADLSLDSVAVNVALVDTTGAVLASGSDSTVIDAALVSGDDTLSAGGGTDTLYGGGGNDTFIYHADKVDGWFDADYQDQGGAAQDGTGITVDSSGYYDTNDTFFGGSGHDTLVMTSGDDAIHISHLNSVEVINAGAGDDIVDLNFSDGSTYGSVTVDGGSGNDIIFANDGNDTLIGGIGNDTISGDAGNDLLVGGAGADKLIGGSGIDTADFSDSTSGVNVYLGAGDGNGYSGAGGYGTGGDAQGDTYSGIENVVGSSHDDYVYGSASGSVVDLGAGNDTFDNSEAANVVASDTVDGGAGNDLIFTGNGNDLLIGGSGNDTLNGEAGNDTLIGGTGDDVMNGGNGSDTFLFDFGDGHDTVYGGTGTGGTENWTDTLDLTNLGNGVTFTVTMDNGTSWTATTDSTEQLAQLGEDASGKVVIQHSDNTTDTIDFHSLEQIKW